MRSRLLLAVGRSRQSFSQFCSNFSSGHFAAREEGKKEGGPQHLKEEGRIRKRKEEATANSIGLDGLGGG